MSQEGVYTVDRLFITIYCLLVDCGTVEDDTRSKSIAQNLERSCGLVRLTRAILFIQSRHEAKDVKYALQTPGQLRLSRKQRLLPVIFRRN